MKEKLKNAIYIFRLFFIILIIRWNDVVFKKDLERWKVIYKLNMSDFKGLAWLLWEKPEFRNLLIYRNRNNWFNRIMIKLFYPPMNTLFLEAKEIGGGLFIQHGFATMISAESIGENCWINQQVTIGYNGEGKPPVIGNNVMITCGAKILGNITIGDGAIIGANAVVIKDVKSGVVMGGVPAKQIK